MKKNLIFIFLIVIILAGAGIWYANNKGNKSPSPSPSPSPIAQVTYICNGDKTIDAAFYKGEPKPVEPGEPPIPSGSVKIVLSDGRNFDLPQTISADGGRYANSDESFVFWSKGNGALVLEDNIEKSYIGCVVLVKDPGGLPKVYLDGTVGFSIRYPADYSIDTSYKYQALGPGKDISGVKFTIPSSLATGTNLSSFNTGVSVEIIPAVQDCNAGLFLDGNTSVQTITDNGSEYSFASTTQGAAGNRYEEEVWAIPGTNPCIAVRYFIHSTNIGNYPEGTVSEFDRTTLISQFDKIRQSLITL
jgi:membrane-bound inhibitor of C-type lysozyme